MKTMINTTTTLGLVIYLCLWNGNRTLTDTDVFGEHIYACSHRVPKIAHQVCWGNTCNVFTLRQHIYCVGRAHSRVIFGTVRWTHWSVFHEHTWRLEHVWFTARIQNGRHREGSTTHTQHTILNDHLYIAQCMCIIHNNNRHKISHWISFQTKYIAVYVLWCIATRYSCLYTFQQAQEHEIIFIE